MYSTIFAVALAGLTSASPLIKRQSEALSAYAVVTGDGIDGLFNFTEVPGQGTEVVYSVTGLSNTTGSYPWHIHTNPIIGACTSAYGHLDPLEVGDGFACPSDMPWMCQEGDMSGKWGKIPGSEEASNKTFTDAYVRFYPREFSILGRSVVIHASNGTTTRIACGNISTIYTEYDDYQTDYNAEPPTPPTTTITAYPSGSTDLSLLSPATIPLSLPEVNSESAISLYTSGISQTVAGSLVETERPIPTQEASSFVWSSGAPLPRE